MLVGEFAGSKVCDVKPRVRKVGVVCAGDALAQV